VLDAERRIRFANRTFHRTFEISPDETLGKSLFDLDDGDWAIAPLRHCLTQSGVVLEGVQLEHDFRRIGPRSLLLSTRPIERQLQLLVFQDVTERELLHKSLLRREREFHALLMQTSEAILIMDPTGTLVFCNECASRLFGYSREELIGLPVDRVVPEALAHLRLENPGAASAIAGVGQRKNGLQFPIELTLCAATPDEGDPRFSLFIVDTTEQRQMEAKLRDFQEKLRESAFDAIVTEDRERRRIAVDLHDRIGQALALAQIKLTSISSDVIGEPRDAISDTLELLEQTIADTRTLIFELSPPILYDLGFSAAIGWLIDEFDERYHMPIELSDDQSDKPLDEVSAAVLFRSVRELLMNVRKHSGSLAGRIQLRSTDGWLHVIVEDVGVGFDLASLATGSNARCFGLFSVREQIERLGGSLLIESAPRKGTRVALAVRLNPGDPAADGA
jgi:PAS domain S-box-containing protein